MLCEKCYNAVISKTVGEPEKNNVFWKFLEPLAETEKRGFWRVTVKEYWFPFELMKMF